MRLAATTSSMAAGSTAPPDRGAAPEGRSFMRVLTNAGVRERQTSEFARLHQVANVGTRRTECHTAGREALRRPKLAHQRLPVAIDSRLRHNVEIVLSRVELRL